MKSICLAVAAASLMTACASDSGLVQNKNGDIVVTLKSDAMKEAFTRCKAKGGSPTLDIDRESLASYEAGVYPRIKLRVNSVGCIPSQHSD